MTKKVAIVGAGMAGLACARALRRAGFSTNVFEQEQSVGGRIGTISVGGDRFDHGAQYLAARSREFEGYLEDVMSRGYGAPWTPRLGGNGSVGAPWVVGTPGMSSVVRPLADSARVTFGHRVLSLERGDKGWHLWFEDDTSSGPFDAVALTMPPEQALGLAGSIDAIAEPAEQVRMLPCWSLMVRIDAKNFPEQDVFMNVSDTIRWIARDNTKPGRDHEGNALVVHASPSWSLEAENADPEDIVAEIWSEVGDLFGLPPIRPRRAMAHLWQQGTVDRPLGETHLFCPESRIGAAGDWCMGSFAEDAFESGSRLGRAIAAALE